MIANIFILVAHTGCTIPSTKAAIDSVTMPATGRPFTTATAACAEAVTHNKDAGGNKPLYLGHPVFEGFESLQEVLPS